MQIAKMLRANELPMLLLRLFVIWNKNRLLLLSASILVAYPRRFEYAAIPRVFSTIGTTRSGEFFWF